MADSVLTDNDIIKLLTDAFMAKAQLSSTIEGGFEIPTQGDKIAILMLGRLHTIFPKCFPGHGLTLPHPFQKEGVIFIPRELAADREFQAALSNPDAQYFLVHGKSQHRSSPDDIPRDPPSTGRHSVDVLGGPSWSTRSAAQTDDTPQGRP